MILSDLRQLFEHLLLQFCYNTKDKPLVQDNTLLASLPARSIPNHLRPPKWIAFSQLTFDFTICFPGAF